MSNFPSFCLVFHGLLLVMTFAQKESSPWRQEPNLKLPAFLKHIHNLVLDRHRVDSPCLGKDRFISNSFHSCSHCTYGVILFSLHERWRFWNLQATFKAFLCMTSGSRGAMRGDGLNLVLLLIWCCTPQMPQKSIIYLRQKLNLAQCIWICSLRVFFSSFF